MGRPPETVPTENAEAMEFAFPTTPATSLQLFALRRLVVRYLREVMAVRFASLPAEVLGEAFGLEERRAKEVVGQARNRGITPLTFLVLEVLRGMVAGTVPSVLATPRNRYTRWLFAEVNHHDRLDWQELRSCDWMTAADWRVLSIWHAAFRRDYREWLRMN